MAITFTSKQDVALIRAKVGMVLKACPSRVIYDIALGEAV
jgi:hypothetical protein